MPVTLKGRSRWLIMPVLALGVSLIVIDGTIVNVALPEIIDALQMDLSEAEWTNSLYALVFAALLIAVGATADKFGRRRLFVAGVVVFALASVLAALSQSAEMLLLARALQGVGGALVLPTSLSLVNANFHGRDRAAAFGIWGATIAGMAAVGPVLGGWLTTDFSWRLIFWINPPLALLVIVGALLLVPESKEAGAPGLRDWFGVLLISGGLALVVFGLIEGETYGWWSATAEAPGWWALPGSPVPWALALGVGLLLAFVGWTEARNRRGKATLIDLGLFRLPTFRWGGVTILIVSLGEFGVIFVIPLFLQNVLGMSALGAGLVILALAAGAMVSGGVAAPVSRKLGGHRIVQLGMVLEIAGILWFAFVVAPGVSPWVFVAPLAVYGLGVGFATAQLTNVALQDVPVAESGQASAMQSTLRQVGSALGTAVLGVALALAVTSQVTASVEAEGVPAPQAEQIATAVKASAGTAIPKLSSAPETAPLASALDQSFADAVQVVGWTAAGFVFLGLLASLRIPGNRPRDGT
ncbi:MAG: DHA2 family efflux MFS transporter permease subunit [Miltoncostaeaceae bacterium]